MATAGGPHRAAERANLVCYRTVRKSGGSCEMTVWSVEEADLQLGRRQVDVGHHLGAGVLHLQTGVELQEVEAAVLAVEVLHGPGADVAHHLCQLHCTLRRGNDA